MICRLFNVRAFDCGGLDEEPMKLKHRSCSWVRQVALDHSLEGDLGGCMCLVREHRTLPGRYHGHRDGIPGNNRDGSEGHTGSGF